MAGRHRKTPAWRRLLLRLRRSDRAARTAALQAEVVALRATVRSLRAELDSVWAAAAAARAADVSRWGFELPLVQAALAPAEVGETAAAAAAAALPALAGAASIELDLRPDTTTTEILLAELRQIVLADLPVVVPANEAAIVLEPATVPANEPANEAAIVLAELPESALLDPKKDRDADVIDVNQPVTASAAKTVLPERRSA